MRRMSSVACAVVAATFVVTLALRSHLANADGSMEDPISRVYNCYRENPEHPTSAACQAAVALSGTQPFYDWNEVYIANASGQHRELIPDGQLCSAGLAKYAALDLARDDWVATTLSSGVNYTFLYKVTAEHFGYFEFYVTKDSYDPTEPLKWSDLEDKPFITVTNPPLSSGDYQILGTTPSGKSGRHLVYVIWQRTDSFQAFYSCSDVVFEDASLLRLPVEDATL